MKKYESQKFNIPELKGISRKNIEEHLKLYEGYVKFANAILEDIEKLSNDGDDGLTKHLYAITEMQRRFSFEFNGMRNHEYYFKSFENGGPNNGSFEDIKEGKLIKAIESEWGSFEKWFSLFKTIAKTRGVGWAILYFDPLANNGEGRLVNGWIDEQHLGQLNGLVPILPLDMWEHSFVSDYFPSGKPQYVDDFFENLNWRVMEDNYKKAIVK